MSDMLKRLLGAPDVRELPTAKVELPRLSSEGEPFALAVRTLSWKQVGEISAADRDDARLKLILAACPELSQRLAPEDVRPGSGIVTAEDVLKSKLLPGEIDRLVSVIDRLCGYKGKDVVKEIKN